MMPLLIDEIAMMCPETPRIMAHMGGYRVMDGLAVALKIRTSIWISQP